jgi:hypothetical protein
MSKVWNARLLDWRLLLPCAAAALALLAWALWPRPAAAPPVIFYAVVLDEDGRPVDGAQIAARAARLVSMDASVVAANSTARALSAQTDAQGKFTLTLPVNYDNVLIESVGKPGYEWVIDWAWTLGRPYNHDDNRNFNFAGPLLRCNVYRPEIDHPAVFPLHSTASTKPVGKPSRGGSEIGCDRRIVPNKSETPKVPSTGPGAPHTPKEIENAIGTYLGTQNKQRL